MTGESGWAPAALEVCGFPVLVRSNSQAVCAALRMRPASLIPNARSIPAAGTPYTYALEVNHEGRRSQSSVWQKGRKLGTFRSATEAFCCIRSHLQFRIARASREYIFVHAGVVGWKGWAIVLPGRSFTGKSTLVAALLRLGATYYSDEYALIDTVGRVHPFACPLNIRSAAGTGARVCRPESLGVPVGSTPLDAGLIIASRYRPSAEWTAASLSCGEAVLVLMANAVAARRYPAEAMQALGKAALRGRAFRVCRGEADAAGKEILGLFQRGRP